MKLKTGEEKMKNKDMTKIANKIIEKMLEVVFLRKACVIYFIIMTINMLT